MENTRLSLLLFALLACHATMAVQEQDGVTMLPAGQDEQDADDQSRAPAKEMKEMESIESYQQMAEYIDKGMDDVKKKVLSTDDDSDEEIAIGNTLKSMEAKHAVEEELESEVKVDCEMGEWGKFEKCSKVCDGGVMQRSRVVVKQSQNGGKLCEKLNDKSECNAESCASQTYQRRATRRKLTKTEKDIEHRQNMELMEDAKQATTVSDMMKKSRVVMRKIVHTQLANVRIPGEPEETDESAIRKILKEAMAKNAVDNALKTVGQEEEELEKTPEGDHAEALKEKITKTPSLQLDSTASLSA